MIIDEVIAQFQKDMPPAWPGTETGKYTGGNVNWRSLQNEKSRGETPPDMFIRQGSRKLLVVRDKFLPYWQSKLSAAEATK